MMDLISGNREEYIDMPSLRIRLDKEQIITAKPTIK